MSTDGSGLEEAFAQSREYLFAICYRLTGNPSDAEDLVQETFARALEKPPPEGARAWRPWLTKVAVNLGIDQLRRRKAAPYAGVWLPGLVETAQQSSPDSAPGAGTRYDLLESATVAFLVALEALTPQQRAVLLMRDVFDESVRETAELLGLTDANVKVIHHRARAAMAHYDQARVVPTRELQEKTRHTLEAFLSKLLSGDVAGVETMLAESVRAVGDGNGRYLAGLKPVIGVQKVARLYFGIMKRKVDAQFDIRMVNGLPALVMSVENPPAIISPRTVLQLEVDERGLIREVHSVVVPEKLRFIAEA